MEDEKAMMESMPQGLKIKKRHKKRRTTFFLVWSVFLCVFFAFAAEVYANGNVSADEFVSRPQVKKSVRRAPIKRPAKKKTSKKRVIAEEAPPMPTPLEIGISLIEDGRYEQARPWLQKAVQGERYNPYAWYWYGMVHEKMGQFQQAQFFYARTLALDPAFPPFARVVTYPDEGDRKPLWDPLRPPRVYPVETVTRGVAIIPPSAPEATVRPLYPPVDPEIPKVPRYVPPEPVEPIIPGDALQPPVYVPPSAPEPLVPVAPVQTPLIPAAPVPSDMAEPSIYMPTSQPVPSQSIAEQMPMAAPPAPQAIPVSPAPGQPPVYTPPAPEAAPAPPAAREAPVYTPPPPEAAPTPPAAREAPVYTPPPPEAAPAPPAAGKAPVYMPPSPQAAPAATAEQPPVYTPPPPPGAE